MSTIRIFARLTIAFCVLASVLAAPAAPSGGGHKSGAPKPQTNEADVSAEPRVAFNPELHCSEDAFVAMSGHGELAAVNACLEFGTSADSVRA